jgi:hypothetical protein
MGFCGHPNDPISETDVPAPDVTVDAAHLTHDFTLGVWLWSQVGTVNGTITLPASATGKDYMVIIDDNPDDQDGFVNWADGECQSPIDYEIEVPPGTYYLYALVDIDEDEVLSDGDYAGYYGPDDPSRPQLPPATANVTVADAAPVQCDFALATWPLKYDLTFSTNGSGTTDTSGTQQVTHDTWFDIDAEADCGYAFSGWTSIGTGVEFDDPVGTKINKVRLIDGDATVTANFDAQTLSIQISSPTEGQEVSGILEISGTHTGPVTDITLTINQADYVVSNINSPGCGEWFYSDFNTAQLSDGDVEIEAVANSGQASASITVSFDNQPELSGTINFSGSGTISSGTPLIVYLSWEANDQYYYRYQNYTSGAFPRNYEFEDVEPAQLYWIDAYLENGDGVFGIGDFYGYYEDVYVANNDVTGIDFALDPDPIADGRIFIEVNNIPAAAEGAPIIFIVVEGDEEPEEDMSNWSAANLLPVPEGGGTVSDYAREIGDPDPFDLGDAVVFNGGYYSVYILADLNENLEPDEGDRVGYDVVITLGDEMLAFHYWNDLEEWSE